ncbi:MAG: hypothetical protein N3F06_03595 [Nitrososphaerales archaeon]|nr:hypothetical protein [Nitrososphaerales archaeon]
MAHSRGFRRKTRHLLSSEGLRNPASPFLIDYKVGDKVVIDINPSQVKGMPHRRFQGFIGDVEEVRKRSVVVKVHIGGKIKKVIARLEHVKPHLKGVVNV